LAGISERCSAGGLYRQSAVRVFAPEDWCMAAEVQRRALDLLTGEGLELLADRR